MAPIEHISTEVHTENGDTIVVTATRPGEFVVCNLASLSLGNLPVEDEAYMERTVETAKMCIRDRPCGGAEEGWSRLLRRHSYGYAHPAGGAGGLRGQGHRGEKEHETGRGTGQGRRRGHRFLSSCGGDRCV